MMLELIMEISTGPVLVRASNPGYVAVPNKADMSMTKCRAYLKLLSESAYYTWLCYGLWG